MFAKPPLSCVCCIYISSGLFSIKIGGSLARTAGIWCLLSALVAKACPSALGPAQIQCVCGAVVQQGCRLWAFHRITHGQVRFHLKARSLRQIDGTSMQRRETEASVPLGVRYVAIIPPQLNKFSKYILHGAFLPRLAVHTWEPRATKTNLRSHVGAGLRMSWILACVCVC